MKKIFSVWFAVGILLLNVASVYAGEDNKKNSETNLPNRFGVVLKLRGTVEAGPASGGKVHKLHLGSELRVGDVIRTSSTGEAVIKTDDAGYVGVRPGTVFMLESYEAKGGSNDNFAVQLLSGSLRVISGWIGQVYKDYYKIHTPYASMGIRGTDHEPYVLTPESAAETSYEPGTYDKVNRGIVVMGDSGAVLEIKAGYVGFQRDLGKNKKRGMMTIMLPRLLEEVPTFFVPGQFDAELDRLSTSADDESIKLLNKKQGNISSSCDSQTIARDWLERFDGAVAEKNAERIISLFAPDVKVHALVNTADGTKASLDFNRDELAQSTLQAIKDLKEFQQKRHSLEAHQLEGGSKQACSRVEAKSTVVEQGVQGGLRYRIESTEEYILELRDNHWLAVHVLSTQK